MLATHSIIQSVKPKLSCSAAHRVRSALMIATWLLFSVNLHALEASLSSKTIALNKTVTLTINSFDNANLRQLDLSPLENNFEVSNPDISSVYQITNGSRSSKQSLSVTLKPKQVGRLPIPSFRLGNRASKPLLLTVTAAVAAPDQLYDGVVIAKAQTSKHRVTVGETFIYTLQLYHLVDQESAYNDLNLKNADSEPLSSKSYTASLQGKTYTVQELRFVVKPLSAGKLTIESPTIKGQLYQNGRGIFRSRGVPFEIAAKTLAVDVSALPSGIDSATIVAEALDLSESAIDGSDLKVGQPITRRIQILAKGSKAEALPDIKIAESDSFSVYEEPSQFHNEEWLGGYAGTRTETFAIVPTKPGPLRLPAIAIEWWNTQSQQLETATLPAVTFDVAADLSNLQTNSDTVPATGNAVSDSSMQSTGSGTQTNTDRNDDLLTQSEASQKLVKFWRTAALILLATSIFLSTIVLSLVLRSRRPVDDLKPSGAEEKTISLTERAIQSYENALAACKSGDILAAKQAVSIYLDARKRRDIHPELTKQLGLLDQRLYAATKPDLRQWEGSALAQSLKIDAQRAATSSAANDAFSHLYPSPK